MPESPRVRFIAYSDYLCPWCYNAAVRLERLEREHAGRVEVEWRSFLLRPRPDPERSFEKFVRYTQSWSRPASEPDSGSFQVWQTEFGPPSHSLPPHLAAKAAKRVDPAAYRRLHERLLRAYFSENLDITDRSTLLALWKQCGLAEQDFAQSEDPALVEQVIAEHNEALECGTTGVPAVRVEGVDAVLVGAQPYAIYERWLQRLLEAQT